jgi:hypothetical protein
MIPAPMTDPRGILRLVRPPSGMGPDEAERPLTEEELLALVDRCVSDQHRWLAYRAVVEIARLRRQAAERDD